MSVNFALTSTAFKASSPKTFASNRLISRTSSPSWAATFQRETSAAVKAVKPGKRAKAEPRYQSKKNNNLKWSGRGVTPVWMREEMKGTKLTKDSFLIK